MSEAETDQAAITKTDMLALTCTMVAAYVSHNATPIAAVPGLIADAHAALTQLVTPAMSAAPPAQLKPSVSIKASVQPDHIVCLENGKKFKSLKRHLAVEYGMTPDQYRARWGLPKDYPMVAPAYAKARSDLAKNMGLGRKAAANNLLA